MSKQRICLSCRQPIRKTHRWRTVRRSFLFLTWERYRHHNCAEPERGPVKPRDPREQPLPFPESA